MTKLTIKNFKAALDGSYGVRATIAKKCNVHRSAITRFLQTHPKMLILLEEEQEKIIDIAENRLHSLINDKDVRAIKFFLATKGKSRGYVPKQEVDLGGEIKSNVDLSMITLCQAYNEGTNPSDTEGDKQSSKE